MVKAELINSLAQKHNLNKIQAQKVIDTMFDTMAQALAEGKRVEIRGFASLKTKQHGGYIGRDPRTNQSIQVLPKIGVIFRAGSDLRHRVNRPDRQESD